MIRDESQQEYFKELGVSTVMGDLDQDFSAAYKEIDRVIFVAGSGPDTGKDKTVAVDQEGAKKSIDFAKEAGVKKYVMLNGSGSARPEFTHPFLSVRQAYCR
jgi:nucleoside-diphosphate-sugar epimerase